MSESPLVSVVIIFLDMGRYLGEAIASVFAQEYGRWELLLVDDGSSDASSALARRCAAEHPGRVRYLEHPGHANRGMSASRNLGIREARGGLVALLDADDVWLPHKLARQVDILTEHPDVGMVVGRSLYWYSWTGRHEDARRDRVPPRPSRREPIVEPPRLLLGNYPLGRDHAPCPTNLLFRAEVTHRTGSFEDTFTGELQMYEDQAFLAKVYLKEKVYVSDEVWDLYRQHPTSCVTVVKKSGGYDSVRLHYLTWLQSYLDREGVRDGRVDRAMRRAFWMRDRPQLYAMEKSVGKILNFARRVVLYLYWLTLRWAARIARLVKWMFGAPFRQPLPAWALPIPAELRSLSETLNGRAAPVAHAVPAVGSVSEQSAPRP